MSDLSGRPGSLLPQALATDGTYLDFVWYEETGDSWVMDVVDEGDRWRHPIASLESL